MVLVHGGWNGNAVRFATEDEAMASARDLMRRWTLVENYGVLVRTLRSLPMPVIAASLFARFASRQDESPTMKAVAALRNQFGGHAVKRVPLSG